MGKQGKTKNFFLDNKMRALVQQFVSEPSNQPVMVDNVVEYICSLRDYQRTNRQAVKLSVVRALDQIRSLDSFSQKNQIKRPGEDWKKDGEDDSDDAEEVVEAKDYNLLNASLRKTYKEKNDEIQQQQLLQQQNEANAQNADNDSMQTSSNTNGPSTPISNGTSRTIPKRPLSNSPAIDLTSNGTPTSANGSTGTSAAGQIEGTPTSGTQKKRRKLVKNTSSGTTSSSRSLSSSSSSSKSFIEPSEIPSIGYEALGGIDSVLQDVREHVEWPMLHPEVFSELRVPPSRGVLLHGPPGCGKSILANAIAGELGRKLNGQLTFYKLSAPELVSGMSGESENNLRQLFEAAKESEPSLIFIDEIDVICTKRDNAQKEMERRIVAQLLTSFDDLATSDSENPCRVLLIGATNRVDSLDPSLRRNGRFDKEIALGVPDDLGRAHILSVHASRIKVSGDFDFMAIARKTPGFVGADIAALVKEAAAMAVKRIIKQFDTSAPDMTQIKMSLANFSSSAPSTPVSTLSLNGNDPMMVESSSVTTDTVITTPKETIVSSTNVSTNTVVVHNKEGSDVSVVTPISPEELSRLCITMSDFEHAIKKVQPSAKREGFATIPNVTWDDVGALQEVRGELYNNIIAPVKFPWKFKLVGLEAGAGVLLYGPPGCGKTLLAKAIANDCSASFISVKGPELLNKFVGESERAVRRVFERAKLSRPCIIFFDELDALCPRREDDGNQVTGRVVNQLLTEMDGLEERKGIFIIGATNRPDIIDPAMLRPQRLDKRLFVPLPNKEARFAILETCCRRSVLESNINLKDIADQCERFSGADLAALVKEAKLRALMRDTTTEEDEDTFSIKLTEEDFKFALTKITPSVSKEDEKKYLKLKSEM